MVSKLQIGFLVYVLKTVSFFLRFRVLRLCRWCPINRQNLIKRYYIPAASWVNQQFAYAKTKTQISFAETAKLISAFPNPKFPASSHILCFYGSVCVGPVRKQHYWFSHETAQLPSYDEYIVLKPRPGLVDEAPMWYTRYRAWETEVTFGGTSLPHVVRTAEL